jgi:hypothetical protein
MSMPDHATARALAPFASTTQMCACPTKRRMRFASRAAQSSNRSPMLSWKRRIGAAGSLLDPEEGAVEVAQKRGLLRRTLFSWGGLFWSAAAGLPPSRSDCGSIA